MNDPIDVFALFEEGNPVPDSHTSDHPVHASTYLESLLKAKQPEELTTMSPTPTPTPRALAYVWPMPPPHSSCSDWAGSCSPGGPTKIRSPPP